MAKDKKSFLLYCDIIHTVEQLPREKIGDLFIHILQYVNDKNPSTDDIIVKIAFEPIKQQLKRDLVKYSGIIEKRSKAGLTSAENRKQNQHMSTHVESVQQTSTNPTVNDNVTVTVNDNVNVTEKEKPLSVTVEGEKPSPTTKKHLPIRKDEFRLKCIEVLSSEREKYYQEKEENKKFFEYWTEHGPKDLKMRFEKETSFEIAKRLDRWFENVETKRQKINQGGEKLTKFQQTIQNGEAGTLKAIEAIKLRKQQEAQ